MQQYKIVSKDETANVFANCRRILFINANSNLHFVRIATLTFASRFLSAVMIFLPIIMFNLLVEKSKKLLNSKSSCVAPHTSSKLPSNVVVFDSQMDDVQLKETIFDIIKTIKDPEKPATLEDLNVVQEDDIHVVDTIADGTRVVKVVFTPTVPHCSLATLIGLCIRVKLQRTIVDKIKIDIYVKEGTHSTESDINKQVNDKERVAAAMENPNLIKIVENCIKEDE